MRSRKLKKRTVFWGKKNPKTNCKPKFNFRTLCLTSFLLDCFLNSWESVQLHKEHLLHFLWARRQIFKWTEITEWTWMKISYLKSQMLTGGKEGARKETKQNQKRTPNPTTHTETPNPKLNNITQKPTKKQHIQLSATSR